MGELLEAADLVMALDYGQLYLRGWSDFEPEGGIGPVAERAIRSPERVAGDGWALVVISPHRNNFDMHVRVERWSGPAPDDLDAWQEAVEGPVTVEGGRLWLDSPTMTPVSTPVPDNHYLARVCGRGFVNRGDTPTTTPGDVWRVQIWPAVQVRRLRSWNRSSGA
jgi:hypothetical protein